MCLRYLAVPTGHSSQVTLVSEVNHVCGFSGFSPPTDTYKNVKKKKRKKKTHGPCINQERAKTQSDGTGTGMKGFLRCYGWVSGNQESMSIHLDQSKSSGSCPGTESTGKKWCYRRLVTASSLQNSKNLDKSYIPRGGQPFQKWDPNQGVRRNIPTLNLHHSSHFLPVPPNG